MGHTPVFTIRKRITLTFIGIVTLMMVSIWLLDTFLLEPFYTQKKLQVMETSYDYIDSAIRSQMADGSSLAAVIDEELKDEMQIWSRLMPDEDADKDRDKKDGDPAQGDEKDIPSELENSFVGSIRAMCEKNSISLIFVDSETGDLLLNFGRESDFLTMKIQRYVLGQNSDRSDVMARFDNYVIEKNKDRRSDSSYLEAWGYFSDNSTMFMMQMPLSGIHDSVALANRFTMLVGLAVLLAGSCIMYAVSRRITTPIMKLAALSERMSELDFDARYEGHENDEVGVLGKSMNVLSQKLRETITELKDANIKLQKDIDEKIEIDDMRKEFIANVSHELKTPIALIQGYAEGLAEGMAEDAESRDYYCGVIVDESAKMNRLLKQLLTLTAIEFGNDTPQLERFDICELIRGVINSSSILLAQKGIDCEFDQTEPVFVLADEFKYEQVITNYLNNAMNHVDGKKLIRIRVEKDLKNGKAIVSVFNTGSQIPEESLPHLWTKFYKVDKARTRAYGGSGIGLSIVKAIADAHGESCQVENTADGVIFSVTLSLCLTEK